MCSDSETYLTPTELAERWKVTPNALQMLRTKRRGPTYVKMERKVRYPLSKLLEYETEGTHEPVSRKV